MCYGLNIVSSQNAYIETPTLILWFGEVGILKGNKVMSEELSQMGLISALTIKGAGLKTLSPLPSMIKYWHYKLERSQTPTTLVP